MQKQDQIKSLQDTRMVKESEINEAIQEALGKRVGESQLHIDKIN